MQETTTTAFPNTTVDPTVDWGSITIPINEVPIAVGDLHKLAIQSDDPVNHPSHYASGKIECIDAMEVATEGLNGIEAVCAGNAIKYIWRHQKKGKPIEDIEKAIWYLNHLLEHYKEVK